MEMGQGVRTGIGASPVSYRRNFLAIWTRWNFIIVLNGSEKLGLTITFTFLNFVNQISLIEIIIGLSSRFDTKVQM